MYTVIYKAFVNLIHFQTSYIGNGTICKITSKCNLYINSNKCCMHNTCIKSKRNTIITIK